MAGNGHLSTRRFLCRIGLHRWTHRGWTLIDGIVCVDCGKETWDW